MTDTQKIRGPHDIRMGEGIASKYREGWEVHYAGTKLPESNREGAADHRVLTPDEIRNLPVGARVVNLATGEEAEVSAGPLEKRRLFFDYYEFPMSNRGTCLHLALLSLPEPEPDDEVEAPEDDRRIEGRCPACNSTTLFVADHGYITCSLAECPNPCAAHELLAEAEMQPEPESKDEPDGSWERPWPAYTDPRGHDGWHEENDTRWRQHYVGGTWTNPDGPREAHDDGRRYWDNGTVLPPGACSDDVPGGGADAPWAQGFTTDSKDQA
jgi:hypothetical protein